MAYTTINKSTDYFNTKLYTGNGGTNAITGVGFQPDWIWFKNRTSAQSHVVVDSIRGRVGLQPNESNPQYTLNSGRDFGTFDSDGFTVLNPEQYNSFNYNTGSIVSWNWKANGAGSANTDGSISSTVSANTTSGFSIVKWTGTGSNATIGHGLGVAMKTIIFKRLDISDSWYVFNDSNGWNNRLHLDGDQANAAAPNVLRGITPTSSVFSVGSDGSVNASGGSYIAYCFADVQGFSKFGKYIGNDSATDGPFIYTGFKPAFILGKRTTNAGGWWMLDSKRPGINVTDEYLLADSSQAEADDGSFATDFLSNGFKVRASNGNFNTNGDSYIYMAFAEAPLVGTNNVPANAR